jgi:tetratricopeptide (TPR) repeat protein
MKKGKRKRPAEGARAAPANLAPPRPFLRLLGGLAVGAVAAVLAYRPALEGPFLFDDRTLPFFDPRAHEMPLGAWVSGVRPLLMFTFWVNYRLNGLEPAGYHWLNLAFHCGAALTVYLIARRLLAWESVPDWPREALAAFAAGLFLLHPLHTEAVAYVASRSENLSVMLFYAAYAVFLYRRGNGVRWPEAALILALFAAAVTTKEHTAVLPALLLMTDLWFRSGPAIEAVKRNWRLYLPMAVGAAGAGAFVWRVLRAADTAGFAVEGLPWQKYFLTQAKVIWVYLRMFVLPYGQNIDHAYPPVASGTDPAALAGLAAITGVLAAAWWARRRLRLAAFGVFVFFLLIAPTSSFVPIADPLAERRVYLPSLGLLLVAAALLARWRVSPKALAGALGAVVVVAGLLTHQRNMVWGSAVALWEDSVEKAPGNWRGHFQLAFAYYEAGRCADAVRHYQKVSELSKPDARLLVNWALALDCAGSSEAALDKLRQAAALEPTAHVFSLIGMIRGKRGERDQALEALAEAERLDPRFAMLYVYRGHVHASSGDHRAAAEQYRRALSLDPSLGIARESLAAAERRLGAR